MLKFRPSNLTQKRANISFDELQLIALIEKSLGDNSLRGFLYKRSSPNAKWRMKWFLLFENLLFYFDLGSNHQHQQQQQQQQQPPAASSKGSSSKGSSTFSSLIRRQNKQSGSATKENDWRPTTTKPRQEWRPDQCGNEREPRRASASGTLGGGSGRGPAEQQKSGQTKDEQATRATTTTTTTAPSNGMPSGHKMERPATAGEPSSSSSSPRSRQRLASDPQNLGAAVDKLGLILDYEHPLSSLRCSKTLNSSSISGVSSHFLAHNEQTIGRSTTTTAGKTATSSANYSSLLNKKIGVIFLEGSYCERLVDSAANFTGAGSMSALHTIGRSAAAAAAKSCPSKVELEAAAARCELLLSPGNNNNKSSEKGTTDEEESELNCIFTLTWKKEGSKEYQFRTETEAECRTWVHTITNARYSTLLDDKEQLEQKYLHLSQIIESESTAKWQYSRQCEELSAEIMKLRQEICLLKRQESRTNHLRLALSKSAAIAETILQQQRRRQRLDSAAANSGRPHADLVSPSSRPSGVQQRRTTAATTATGDAAASSLEEQEVAMRRAARRCTAANSVLLTQEELRRQSEALRALIRSARWHAGDPAGPQLPTGRRSSGANEGEHAPDDGVSHHDNAGGDRDDAAAADDEQQRQQQQQAYEHALGIELETVVEALNGGLLLSDCLLEVENSEEIRKIKKVQGFFRGWLCRRRWKQIVQEYIKSPHAESMRKRNNLVFRMVECEEEYVEQLALLISAFLRPIKMAASSQRPALSHDELNSIFLNSETLLFLHQIFLKGLTARMESWPTLVLGDLFNMLLPMLTIYQEFVRNHHYSLQVLAECKQREPFGQILRRLEDKPQLNGRTLETFLTYPMHQIPRYIICLHEILAHTPHNHVERKSLYEAQTKLEDLSRQMHDEVSETENIRQNLAIERMIIGGCDILLDVNQVFVRQGILVQVVEQTAKGAKGHSRLASFGSSSRQQNRHQQQQQQQQTSDCHAQVAQTNSANSHQTTGDNQTKELIRQCFLFTNHLLLCTRTKDGKLHLLESIGRVSLSEVTLIENPLEFVQQQETMIANFESIPRHSPPLPQQQQQRQSTSRASTKQNRAKNSSCNSISDCRSDGTANSYMDNDKRASTASVPAKWGANLVSQANARMRNHEKHTHSKQVDYEDHHQHVTSSIFLPQLSPPLATADTTAGQLEASNSHEYGGGVAISKTDASNGRPAGSPRRRIAGFLATKLSNLANLGSGSGNLSQQHQAISSCSAPPSPMTSKRNLQFVSAQTPVSSRRSTNASHSRCGPLATGEHGLFWTPLKDYAGCDFILLLEPTSKTNGTTSVGGQGSHHSHSNPSAHSLFIHLIAPSPQEKAAWMSDISQCIDNVHFNDLYHGSVNDSSSVTMNQSVRTDPRLYKDDVDIKFSRALNSCKLPQIRYASKERLFERLTDLRFLSIDFLNTFLLTYRVFTTAEDVLEALKSVHYNCDRYCQQQQQQQQQHQFGRDSISALANSSSNSLNDNPTTLTNDRCEDHPEGCQNQEVAPLKAPTPVATPIATASVVCNDRSGEMAPTTTVAISPQPRPSVPCRSPAHLGGTQMEHAKFLSAPSPTQHQKRRSTISALTPITGSTSSSLANLTCIPKSSIGLTSGLHQQFTTATSLLRPECDPEADGVISADQEQQISGGSSSNNVDNDDVDNLNLALSDDDDEEASCTLGGSLFAVANRDRARSSSMSQARAPVGGGGISRANLDVPNSRQVRASSFSHVRTRPDPAVSWTKRGSVASPVLGQEHWRLSYKKVATKEPTESHTEYLTAGQPANNDSARRASSSDSNVVFHVTLEPPPAETPVQSNGGGGGETWSCQSRCPSVPPSTPIEPDDESGEHEPSFVVIGSECDKSTKTTNTRASKSVKRPSATCQLVSAALVTSSNSSSAVASSDSSSSSPSSSSLDSNLPPKKSLSTSESESDDILDNSRSSGLDVFKGAPSPFSTYANEKRTRHNAGRKRAAKRQPTVTDKSTLAAVEPAAVQHKKTIRNFIIKEIELTESAVLDCDTSADEDKIQTSSGDDDDDDDEQTNATDSSHDDFIAQKGDVKTRPSFRPELGCDGSKATDEITTSRRLDENHKSSQTEPQLLLLVERKSSSTGTQTVIGMTQSDLDQNEVRLCNNNNNEAAEPSSPGANSAAEILPASCVRSQQQQPLPTKSSENLRTEATSWPGQLVRPSVKSADGPCSRMTTPRSSFQHHTSEMAVVGDRISKAGVIVSSSLPRIASRRSSTASAASAFAAATAASNNPLLTQPPSPMKQQQQQVAANCCARLANELMHTQTNHTIEATGRVDSVQCLCLGLHRGSFSSAQANCHSAGAGAQWFSAQQLASRVAQPKSGDFTGAHARAMPPMNLPPGSTSGGGGTGQLVHHPSCGYSQQANIISASPSNFNPAAQHSDVSSLCNSRASSRLSSCAGLDYSSYSSAQVNFYTTNQHQQFVATSGGGSGQALSPGALKGSGCQNANTGRSGSGNGSTSTTTNQPAGRCSVAPSNRSKRNSTQINIRSVATIRVLSVLRHWVSKHSQDFINDTKLSYLVQEFLQDLIMDASLLPAEHKAALQLQQMVQKATHSRGDQVDLDLLLATPTKPSPDSIETLSALEIAEGMTYLDHKIFLAIRSGEFLGQAWMKMDKAIKAPHILLITKRFNDVSRLVSSEIIRVPELHRRVAIIEKWTNVAHICRVVHNFNGVLQICAAFTNSAVFRLKKTWDKIPKTTKTTIDQLQNLVSTDSRFRNMRDAINRCDPPSIPYVGMYLTDLSFIEEGTPNYSPDGLLNFSKMRMIAHVIREIQHLQNGSYKIELNPRVANYLLDGSHHLPDDEMYRCSLEIEPRSSGGKSGVQILNSVTGGQQHTNNSEQ